MKKQIRQRLVMVQKNYTDNTIKYTYLTTLKCLTVHNNIYIYSYLRSEYIRGSTGIASIADNM